MTNALVFDVTTETFQRDVVERSMQTPVLLDFWAAWCGPCRTLGPVLEQIATEFGGSFALGKVDTEREPDLAYAFQVQGIPFCVLVDGGRPIDAFQGALRDPEVRSFLKRHSIGPGAQPGAAPGVAPAAAPAAPAAPPPVAPDSPQGRLQRALGAAGKGDAAAARAALAGFPEDDERIDTVRRLADGLAFLEAPLSPTGAGAEGTLARARQRLAAGDANAAMEQILQAALADKDFRGGLPRKAMLLCFLIVGEEDERIDAYRRRLATLLY